MDSQYLDNSGKGKVELRKVFIENYAVQMEFPCFYYKDA
jgi:hypothetical protein